MKTSLQCWITSLPMYIGGCLLIKYMEFQPTVYFIGWIIGFISFLLFAPADTPARPLIYKNKRIRAKIFSIIILVVYFILFYNLNNYILKNVIIYGVLMESITINPITYKVFNTPFNNYKTIRKKLV